MVTRVLGVDPGAVGAFALVARDGELFAIDDMPDNGAAGIAALVASWLPVDVAVVEDVTSFGQGRTSAFNFGRNVGTIHGVLAALQVPVERVTPARWKKAMRLGKDKAESRRRACELWPGWAGAFARVKDDGRAEAALIARWHHENTRVA